MAAKKQPENACGEQEAMCAESSSRHIAMAEWILEIKAIF
jgi:hypothetical protein